MQILLTISYDGTNYAGWQRQENAIAVQQKLEETLSFLLKCDIKISGASRTDAGVHALGQRACFTVPELRIPLDKLPTVLSGLLPPDISVTAAEIKPPEFSPRFNALHKTYVYNMYNATHPNPLLSRYSTFVPQKVDIEKMRKAALHFIGKHDFAAFCATGSSAKTTVRDVYACDLELLPTGIIAMTINGNAFLYNMVRIIAGTVLYVGLGKIQHCDIPDIIAAKDRTLAGKTMPPEGLVLLDVAYE